MHAARVPDRADRHRRRRDALARAPGRGALDGAVLRRPRASRSSAPAAARTRSARRWSATSSSAATPAGSTSSTRPPTRSPGCRRTRRCRTSPDQVDLAIVAVPAEAVAGRRPRLRGQGRARADRDLERVRRDRRGGPPAAAPAGRAGPLVRAAAGRPELPGRHQHRPRRRRSTPRSSPVMPPRGRVGFFCQSGALGRRDPGERSPGAGSASRRSSRPATAPTSPATTCCSTGRRTPRPRSCCSTWSRSATRASSPGSPAGSGAASRWSR